MSNSDESDFNRRRFLRTSVAAAIGGVCFTSASIKQALAEARQSGKPLFTEKNFNALIPQEHNKTLRRLLHEARQDIRGFIRQRFYLTREQKKELNSLSDELIRKIQASIDEVLKTKSKVHVQITRKEDKPRQNHVSSQTYDKCVGGYTWTCNYTVVYQPNPTCWLKYEKGALVGCK